MFSFSLSICFTFPRRIINGDGSQGDASMIVPTWSQKRGTEEHTFFWFICFTNSEGHFYSTSTNKIPRQRGYCGHVNINREFNKGRTAKTTHKNSTNTEWKILMLVGISKGFYAVSCLHPGDRKSMPKLLILNSPFIISALFIISSSLIINPTTTASYLTSSRFILCKPRGT